MFRLRDLTSNWALKLTALALAIVLWSMQRAEAPTRHTLTDVPVRIDLQDPGWTIARPPAPATVSVTFTGPVGQLLRIANERPQVVVPVEEVTDSAGYRVVYPRYVRVSGDIGRVRAEDVRPSTVRLFFERIGTRLVPLALPVRGELPVGLELAGPIQVEPGAVRVSGPRRRLERLDSIRLRPLELDRITDSRRMLVAVDTTGLEQLVLSPRRAEVLVQVRPVPLDTLADDGLLGRPVPEPPDTAAPDTTAGGANGRARRP